MSFFDSIFSTYNMADSPYEDGPRNDDPRNDDHPYYLEILNKNPVTKFFSDDIENIENKIKASNPENTNNKKQDRKPENQDTQIYGVGNLSFYEMYRRYGKGLIRVGNWRLRSSNSPWGSKTSHHCHYHKTWTDDKGNRLPAAFDVVPTKGHSFKELKELFLTPVWKEWFIANNYGIIDESTDEIRRSHPWRSSGNHYHIGPDRLALKDYGRWLQEENNKTNMARKGGILKGNNGMFVRMELPERLLKRVKYLDNIYSPILPENPIDKYLQNPFYLQTPTSYDFSSVYDNAKQNNNLPTQQSTETKDTISDDIFLNLMKWEGSNDKNNDGVGVAEVERKDFGETFATGPYGMTTKCIDQNGNPLPKPIPFKEGEKVDLEWAKKNAKFKYTKRFNRWKQLLAGKSGVTQEMLEALSSCGGTWAARKSFEDFILSHWGDWDTIKNYWRNHATTAAGNKKEQPGLVIRRLWEVNWFFGKKHSCRFYQDLLRKHGLSAFKNKEIDKYL